MDKEEDDELKDAVEKHNGKNWEATERKTSVRVDGTVPWTTRAMRRPHMWVDGQKKKTAR
jgi:hypothetical protein